jgi:ferredoxin-thioredoxin reductase catalytic subunit
MNAEDLYEKLRKIQEPKGYYFNRDTEFVMDLLNSLLINKERYGYMACPCRLASGDREADRDIICPCVYREPDVREYGACYCQLYVSREWNEGKIPHVHVPERRPPEKIVF